MRIVSVSALLFGLFLSAAAHAGPVDAAVVGTWTADGLPLVLKVSAAGHCSIADDPGGCTAAGGVLTFTSPEGKSDYRYTVKAGVLVLTGADLPMPLTFRKDPAGAGPEPIAAEGRPSKGPAPAAPPAAAIEPVAPAAPGAGTPLTRETWGARFTVPAGWKSGEKNGSVVLGGETEAGIMIVSWFPKTTRAGVTAEFEKGFTGEGVSLSPAGGLKEFRTATASGLAGELAGAMPDGHQAKARAISLVNERGALVVFGLTTVEKYPTLKARTEQVAQSVSFFAPKVAKGADVLAGRYQYFYVSKSGGYSRSSKITLCSDGRFNEGGEMSGSGADYSVGTQRGNGGTWTSSGDASQGTVTLTYGNGEVSNQSYAVSMDPKRRSGFGPGVNIGSTAYERTGNGDCR